MAPEDKEKPAFLTPRGVFCYRVMPFGLKNAGATFQRMIVTLFSEHIGKTVEAYIDEMVVKSKKRSSHLMDLQLVFDILRKSGLRLNAEKCTFGVGSGKQDLLRILYSWHFECCGEVPMDK